MIFSVKLFIILLSTSAILIKKSLSTPCDDKMSILVDNGVLKNGNLIINDESYNSNQYFVDEKNNIRLCICNLKTCVRKCCNSDEMYFNSSCTKTEDTLKINDLPLNSEDIEDIPGNRRIILQNFTFIYGFPCKIFYAEENFTISDSGVLNIVNSNEEFELANYCVDIGENNNDPNKLTAFICFPVQEEATEKEDKPKYHKFLTVVFTIVFFLLLLGYPNVPHLKNLQGLYFINYTFCLFLVHSSIAICYYFMEPFSSKKSSAGYVFYFSYCAAVLWMTIMHFDIQPFLRFKKKYPGLFLAGDKKSKVKIFLIYSAIVWGVSFLISFTLSQCEKYWIFAEPYYEPVGSESIFTNSKKAVWVFFYGPLSFILLVNVVIFTLYLRGKNRRASFMEGMDRNSLRSIFLAEKYFLATASFWLIEIFGFYFFSDGLDLSVWWDYPVFFINGIKCLIMFIITMYDSNNDIVIE